MTHVNPPIPQGDPLPVLFEDDELVVVDKPSGVVTVPGRGDTGPTALERVWNHRKLSEGPGAEAPRVLHRLDKDTSGVLAFAKTPEAQSRWGHTFTNRTAEKTYLCLVEGRVTWKEMVAEHPLAPAEKKPGRWRVARDGKPSRTDFRMLHRFQKYSWLEAVPQTGRTHQIRLHARALGHPLAVDPYYASAQPVFLSQVKPNYKPSRRGPERPWLSRLPLHATRLVLHLEGEEPRVFESPLPKDLARVVRDLKKYGRGH
jgi:23S rRNA pseudouridine955/2504/2580 synthase/23S rRNA pseudouridine1911/1915/1917 synthase